MPRDILRVSIQHFVFLIAAKKTNKSLELPGKTNMKFTKIHDSKISKIDLLNYLVITLKHTYPRKLGHGSIHPFLPSKRLSSGALRIGFAVPGIEENTAGEPEEESVVCSNFSPASTIVGG